MDLEHLALKLCPIQIVICFSLWINLTTGLSVQLQQLFSYVGGTLLTNQFSLLLIDPCVLAIYQITTHEKHLRYCFWSVPSSELLQKSWHHGHNNRKWLKQSQSHFDWAITHKSYHFSLFWCMFCTATPDISSSSKNINSTARVSRLSFRFL